MADGQAIERTLHGIDAARRAGWARAYEAEELAGDWQRHAEYLERTLLSLRWKFSHLAGFFAEVAEHGTNDILATYVREDLLPSFAGVVDEPSFVGGRAEAARRLSGEIMAKPDAIAKCFEALRRPRGEELS